MMPSSAYKAEHEYFVSNHTGTSIYEISLIASTVPVSILVRNVLTALLFAKQPAVRKTRQDKIRAKPSSFRHSYWRYLIDFVLLIIPPFLCTTILADYTARILIFTLTSLLFILCAATCRKQLGWIPTFIFVKHNCKLILNCAVSGRRPFIVYFRSYVCISTAIAILSVDFGIFPRRFCKAETWGTGGMDVGVGMFMISNAIVSAEARGKVLTYDGSLSSKLRSVSGTVHSCLPLLVLGLLRTVSVKAADYQEHASEYGAHWNFFFTLFVVRVCASCLLCYIPARFAWLCGLVIITGYQCALVGPLGWQKYILHGSDGKGSRSGIIDSNREGIYSCLGYLAIYLGGVALGSYLHRPRYRLWEWLYPLVQLSLLSIFLSACSSGYESKISRRLANFPFVIWQCAYNAQLLAGCLFVEIFSHGLREVIQGYKSPSNVQDERCLLYAVNRSGLFYFLLANVLTGLVNVSMETIYAGPATSVAVVLTYLGTLSLVCVLLHVHDVTINGKLLQGILDISRKDSFIKWQ